MPWAQPEHRALLAHALTLTLNSTWVPAGLKQQSYTTGLLPGACPSAAFTCQVRTDRILARQPDGVRLQPGLPIGLKASWRKIAAPSLCLCFFEKTLELTGVKGQAAWVGMPATGRGAVVGAVAAVSAFVSGALLLALQQHPPSAEVPTLAAGGTGQRTEMLKVFRVRVKAPPPCCPAPASGPSCCGGADDAGGARPAAPSAPVPIGGGGTQQINMVGFTNKGMGYIQFRGWHHADGGSPGHLAQRAFHKNLQSDLASDRGQGAAGDGGQASAQLSRHARTGRRQRHQRTQAHQRARLRRGRHGGGRGSRGQVDSLRRRLAEDDSEISSLKDQVCLDFRPARVSSPRSRSRV